jgi:hypothetical protein
MTQLAKQGIDYFDARKDSMHGNIRQKLTTVLKFEGSEALINLTFDFNPEFTLVKTALVDSFESKHKKGFGFLIENKPIVL